MVADRGPVPEKRRLSHPPVADPAPAEEPPAAENEPAARASSMDSTNLPERARHEPGARRLRRRRSAAHLPVVVAPIDVPEDAEGRVEFFVVRAPEDRDEPPVEASPPAPEPEAAPSRDLLTLGSGWAAVGVLAAVLVLVFVGLDLLLR